MLVSITKINPPREDDRGNAYFFDVRESTYIVVINRKQGTVSGVHYHKGNTKSKSPEIFYLAAGKIKLLARDIKTKQQEEYELEANHKIEVPANIYHEVHALTDIILIEFNVEKEDFAADTVSSWTGVKA